MKTKTSNNFRLFALKHEVSSEYVYILKLKYISKQTRVAHYFHLAYSAFFRHITFTLKKKKKRIV